MESWHGGSKKNVEPVQSSRLTVQGKYGIPSIFNAMRLAAIA
jgi:hypothetical protein